MVADQLLEPPVLVEKTENPDNPHKIKGFRV